MREGEVLKDLDLERANHTATHETWIRRRGTIQEVMEARERTNANRDSAKPNAFGTMRVIVTTRTECR